ncbi:MAG: flagellar biosynthetic protein FliO [Phycisphaerae bacterium]|nr:flagellar biosynthetic protein FliO [Phycisphaerae bacterium]
MAIKIRWLCWIMISVLAGACLGVAAAQEPNDLGVNTPSYGLKGPADQPDVRTMLYKLCVAVGTVLVLGGVAIYVMRVVMPKLGSVSKKRVRVVEVHHLGGRKVVHLIEVGHRQLLVGSTPSQISMLADVTQHWDEAEDMMAFGGGGDKS